MYIYIYIDVCISLSLYIYIYTYEVPCAHEKKLLRKEMNTPLKADHPGRAQRFVFVPPIQDGFMTVHETARFSGGSLPLTLTPTAVDIRTSVPPRRFKPFHRLGYKYA